jgi:hypothetical protein
VAWFLRRCHLYLLLRLAILSHTIFLRNTAYLLSTDSTSSCGRVVIMPRWFNAHRGNDSHHGFEDG